MRSVFKGCEMFSLGEGERFGGAGSKAKLV
jgi:hypothetical protein